MERVPQESSQYKGPKRTLSLEPLEQRLLLQADWTFMVYLDGDNNLESAAIDDFLEMAHVGSTADVNIVAQFDRSLLNQTTGGFGYTNSYGDWSDTRRGLIAKDDMPNTSWGASIGEANMGDPNVLEAFLTWAVTNFPADHYAVILWDHGSGYSGVEFDETDVGFLTMSDLSTAMGNALTATSLDSFDLLNFDGCLMNMAEVAHQVKDVANLMVGSEDTEPLDGLPYDMVLGSLTATPMMSPNELATTMAQDYLTYYGGFGIYSVIDLTEMGALSGALSNFAQTFVNDGTGTDRNQLSQHWLTVPWYDGGDFLDIGVLMTDISGDGLMSQSIRDAADNVLDVYSYTVIANYSGAGSFGGSGLAIYLPDNTGTVDPGYNAGELAFAAQTQWDEFLNWWTGVPSASWTFMMYMSGDNDLEQFAIQDFLEMSSVGSTDAVNIVVQLDRATGFDGSFDDWTDTRRGLVSFGDLPDSTWGTSIGEANMGDPNTLADFVTWAMTAYPAMNYSLTLWDHGGGLQGAVWDYDDGSPFAVQDNLTVAEVDEGLQGAPENVDILRFDACDMSLIEMAYQVRNDASYMVGSEDLGWAVVGLGVLSPYQQILQQLTTDPAKSPRDLAVLMANSYYLSWSVGNLTIMNSVIDLSRVGALANAVDDLAQAALDMGTIEDRVLMDQHRLASPLYPNPAFASGGTERDLGTWLRGVANDANISSCITEAASDALAAYNSAVVANFAYDGTGTGLAIYMPGALPDGSYSWVNFAFADDTQWDEFLGWWAANEVIPIATFQSGSAKVTFFDVWGVQDIDPANLQVKFSGTVVKSIVLGGMQPMEGLGVVVSGATGFGRFTDARMFPGEIAFIASNVGAKSVQINSDIGGEWLNGRSLAGVIFPSDIDGDGNPFDLTSLYFKGGVSKLTVNGTVYGGGLFDGPVKSFQLNNGDLMDDFIIRGDAGKIQFRGLNWGWVWNRLFIDGNVKRLDMPDGVILPEAIVDITGYVKQANIGIIYAGSADLLSALEDLAEVPLATFNPGAFSFFYTRGATLRVGEGISKLTVDWFAPGSIFYDTDTGGDLVEPATGTDQRFFTQYIMSNVLTPQIGQLDVLQGMVNARVLLGADLGDDLLPGGSGANKDTYGPGYLGSLRVGTEARRGGRTFETFSAGGTDGGTYGGGTVADSLVVAGAFRADLPGFDMWGGSGYNLVELHDQYLFEDGSYIGKVDITGQLVSRYNELESAGDDFSPDDPPLYPYFVPFGIGSYMMGSVSIGGAPASPVATTASFGIWPRQSFLFVELPRGLGANS
jgi:hypothetical protein